MLIMEELILFMVRTISRTLLPEKGIKAENKSRITGHIIP